MISLVAVAGVAVVAVACRPLPSRRVVETVGARRRRTSRRATQRALERAWPHAMELVVLAVRAGHLPAAALAVTAPHVAPSIGDSFRDVTARIAAGERFADAVGALTVRLGPSAAPLADSFAAADRYGLPLAPVLERLADEARQRRRRTADSLARQLPVRLSVPLVLCTLPSFVLLAVVPLLLAALSSLRR